MSFFLLTKMLWDHMQRIFPKNGFAVTDKLWCLRLQHFTSWSWVTSNFETCWLQTDKTLTHRETRFLCFCRGQRVHWLLETVFLCIALPYVWERLVINTNGHKIPQYSAHIHFNTRCFFIPFSWIYDHFSLFLCFRSPHHWGSLYHASISITASVCSASYYFH